MAASNWAASRAQPIDERAHDGVAPYPGGEAREPAQRVVGTGSAASPLDVAVHAIGIGPVGLDGHRAKTLLRDQAPGDRRALLIEFVRPMRGLVQQHDAGLADQF
jgi:hypothetical protein